MEWLIENEKEETLLVLIPEGEFLAGEKKFPVRLPAYYLALHPVTNAQYARFVKETSMPKEWKTGAGPERPAVRVSWNDAQAYCEWAGLRLPSELEWEKGARGVDGREYPWGNEWDASKCRNHGNRGIAIEKTSGVWQYATGSSPWGLYQMAGNVWEWCADKYEYDAYARYQRGDLTPPKGRGSRVLRGGSWCIDAPVDCRCAARSRYLPDCRLSTATVSGAPGRFSDPLCFYPFTFCCDARSAPHLQKIFKTRYLLLVI